MKLSQDNRIWAGLLLFLGSALYLVALVLHGSSDFGFVNKDGPIGPGGMKQMITYPAVIFLLSLLLYLISYTMEAIIWVSQCK